MLGFGGVGETSILLVQQSCGNQGIEQESQSFRPDPNGLGNLLGAHGTVLQRGEHLKLQQLPGYGKDYDANLTEAKRLLAEAGYPNGFKTVLMNRAVKLPYIDFGVYLISKWKKIGVDAEHKLVESATWIKDLWARNFALAVDPGGSISGDPDELLVRWITGESNNYGRFSAPRVDELFQQQRREVDEAKRIKLVHEMQRAILDKAWWFQGLGWTRIEVRSSRIRNYEPHPSHWDNRRLQDLWLAKQ